MQRLLLPALLTLILNSQLHAFAFTEVGFRASFDEESDADIWGAQAYALLDPDWEWTLGESFLLDLDAEITAGALVGDDETAAVAHIGPSLEFSKQEFPLSLVLSTGLTLISEDELDEDFDMGGHIQFTSAIGVIWQINEKFNLSYRFEHISNAGIESENPGLDMHAFSIGYEF